MGWAYRISIYRLRALAGASLFAKQAFSPGGSFTLLATSARTCGSIASGPFEFGPCLGADVDAMWVSGLGWQQPPNHQSVQWASLLGSAFVSWNFSRNIAIFARADALIPLEQPRFYAVLKNGTDSTVHRPAPVAARGAFGIELRFF